MTQASIFPAALAAIANFFGEYLGTTSTELTLNGDITSGALTFVVNEVVPPTWPQKCIVTIENEQILVDSWAVKTFTVNAAGRGYQGATASALAAAHTSGNVVGLYINHTLLNQLIADLVAVEKSLFTQASANATGAVVVDFSLGLNAPLATTGNVTGITLTNPVINQWHSIVIKYGGAHTVAFTTTIKWANGVTPTFTSVNGKYDVVSLWWNGTDWVGEFSGNH